MAKDKKYGSYTWEQLTSLLDSCEEATSGIDDLVGDGAVAVDIIRDLMTEITKLKEKDKE